MAITVQITYTGAPGQAKKFAREMMESGIVEKIRAEEGNLQYAYYFPMEDENSVMLVDSWRDQKAIDVHHETEMMGEILRLREKYGLSASAKRYILDDSMPERDKAFIDR